METLSRLDANVLIVSTHVPTESALYPRRDLSLDSYIFTNTDNDDYRDTGATPTPHRGVIILDRYAVP